MQFSRFSRLSFTLAAALLCGAPAITAQTTPQPAAPALLAKFEQEFSSKSAHPGDVISAKVVRELKIQGLDIPKGSKIAGTVTAAQSKKDGKGNSFLAIHFDRVEMKDGKVLPIAGLIVAIGELDNGTGLGPNNVLNRGGAGSTVGDIDAGTDKLPKDEIGDGSTLEGIAMAKNLDASSATELRGIGRDIECDKMTEIKVALFRAH